MTTRSTLSTLAVLALLAVPATGRAQVLDTIKTVKAGGSTQNARLIDSTEIAASNVRSALDAIQKLRPSMLTGGGASCSPSDSLQLFVNGVRRPVIDERASSTIMSDSSRSSGMGAFAKRDQDDTRRALGQGNSMENIRRELSHIRQQDIASIRYFACDEMDPSTHRKNVILVTTKKK